MLHFVSMTCLPSAHLSPVSTLNCFSVHTPERELCAMCTHQGCTFPLFKKKKNTINPFIVLPVPTKCIWQEIKKDKLKS